MTAFVGEVLATAEGFCVALLSPFHLQHITAQQFTENEKYVILHYFSQFFFQKT